MDAFGYPDDALAAFENCLKGEGVDVEDLDVVGKEDKAVGRS